jgi:hypothetical protein
MESELVPRFTPVARDAAFLLRLWMLEHDVSVKVLASALSVHEVRVTSWRTGRNKPDRANAVRLDALTGGLVPAVAWDEPKEAT